MSLRFVVDDRTSNHRLRRREWLRVSSLAALGYGIGCHGLGMGSVRAESPGPGARAPGFGRAKSVILLHASGGQSQLDMWDPKPDAPDGIRGEFASIATSVPNVRLCEHLPQTARLADQFTIIRTMSHDDLDHGSAIYLTLTGQFHPVKSSNLPPRHQDAPALGAILQRIQPPRTFPYSAIHLNGPVLIPATPSPGQYGGFLGRNYEPLTVGNVANPALALAGLDPLPDLPLVRQSGRTSLLDALDGSQKLIESDRSAAAMHELYRQAHSMLSTPRCRQAFDLSLEPDSVRDRYGRFRSGQACLLARRLVEADVPFINVFLNHNIRGQDIAPGITDSYGWDTHNDIFDAMKEHLLPRFDISFSALIEDLRERGLLDTTLVICQGEFGRAPRIARETSFAGSSPGRKHWAATYSIVMAGAGVGKGHVLGTSDRIGAYPESAAYSPGDVAATLFASLGIDPTSHYTDQVGRPIPLAAGRPISELYS